jgi:hypothetical protein
MSYWLRQGLGATEPAYPNLKPVVTGTPGPGECFIQDTACVMGNTALMSTYEDAMVKYRADLVREQCLANAANALPGAQRDEALARCAGQYDIGTGVTPYTMDVGVQPRINAPAPVSYQGGRLTFTTSRGGTALQVGDTWLVSITGASPNAPVTVSGSMPSGSFSGTAMGITDSNGNWSKSGTAGAGDVGAWQESWAVGGAPAGSFSFSISPAVAGSPAAVQFAPAAAAVGASASASSMTVGGFDLSAIPWWGWLAAGGVALFAFGGGRGR